MVGCSKWGVSVICSVIVVVGCSSSPPRSESQALELAEAVCGFVSRCCTIGEMGYYLGPFVEPADCAERLVEAAALDVSASFGGIPFAQVNLPNLAALDRALREGRVRLDRAAVNACVAWLEERACNGPSPGDDERELCGPVAPAPLVPCDAALLVEGRVPEGGACSGATSSFECREGLVCLDDPTGLGDQGTCTALRREGEWCAADEHCATGLTCNLGDGRCQVPAALGEACEYSVLADPWPTDSLLLVRCEAGLTCSPIASTCVARCEQGAECRDDDDCGQDTGLVCLRWDWRAGGTGFCDFPRAVGERCSETDDCEATLDCALDPVVGLRLCRPPLANGEPCDADDQCASHLCTFVSSEPEQVCVALQPIGAICNGHEECASGYCEVTDEGRCAAGVANEESCADGYDAQCSDGYCAHDVDSGEYVCRAFIDLGGACTEDHHCSSEACVAGACASLPLADGERCDDAYDCESSFCNEAEPEPKCRTLPLGIGAPCPSSTACASRVCFNGACQSGAEVGARCGELLFPCNPSASYCDTYREVPQCTAYREFGESCVRDVECRTDCVTRWGRRMCGGEFPGPTTCDGP